MVLLFRGYDIAYPLVGMVKKKGLSALFSKALKAFYWAYFRDFPA